MSKPFHYRFRAGSGCRLAVFWVAGETKPSPPSESVCSRDHLHFAHEHVRFFQAEDQRTEIVAGVCDRSRFGTVDVCAGSSARSARDHKFEGKGPRFADFKERAVWPVHGEAVSTGYVVPVGVDDEVAMNRADALAAPAADILAEDFMDFLFPDAPPAGGPQA